MNSGPIIEQLRREHAHALLSKIFKGPDPKVKSPPKKKKRGK